jgi:hypothetical protein
LIDPARSMRDTCVDERESGSASRARDFRSRPTTRVSPRVRVVSSSGEGIGTSVREDDELDGRKGKWVRVGGRSAADCDLR